jgi:hypothetical protein
LFESAYKKFVEKYGTFNFPSNLSKKEIINDLQKWMELVEKKYKIYYLAIINILYNKPIPKLDIVIGKDPQNDYNFLENDPESLWHCHDSGLNKLFSFDLVSKKKEKEEKEKRIKEKKEEMEKEEKKKKEEEEEEKKRYYYLNKAFYEKGSNRTSNLYDAYSKPNINDGLKNSIYNLYQQQSIKITSLENDINSRKNNINNLKSKLSSINNSITYTQDSINNKNNSIVIKKNNIKEVLAKLNGLVDLLNDKNKEVDIKVNNVIDNENNRIKKLDETFNSKKNFLKEIKDLENKKEENINNMKKNNETLKQKNASLIQMLSTLEEKIKN